MGDEYIHALDGIDLDIKKGDIICLLGTSGSGKSTLLNAIAGLEKPTKGEINIGSRAYQIKWGAAYNFQKVKHWICFSVI